MGTEVTRTVEIDAPPSAVWEVLAVPELWPQWTASMTEVDLLDGRFGPGARVRITQPKLRPAVWTVTDYQAGTGFTWTSRVPGVRTTGEHVLVPMSAGRTRLRLRMRHTGALAWVAHLLLGPWTRRYVALEADGLKRATEHLAGARGDDHPDDEGPRALEKITAHQPDRPITMTPSPSTTSRTTQNSANERGTTSFRR